MTGSEFNIFQKKSKRLIGNKDIATYIHRIQANDSLICE